jgi:futalosine hydrolase
LTRFIERHEVRAIVACGIGGAYPGSGLTVGDVAWASSECYGDLGANSAEGFLDMRELGFPLIAGPEPVYNVLPLQLGVGAGAVPFVTVNTCTGDDATAAALAARTGGCVESMEGAAVVHVARLAGIAVGEVRGISNAVGTRERGAWRVREAAERAQLALLEWVRERR